MLLLIDNYDSFTYNLVHYLGEMGAEATVHRNDALTVAAALALSPKAIVISPGPCDPSTAGICLELVRAAGPSIPILGVCLGHQTIGQAYGGEVVRCHEIMHGKISAIRHTNTDLFHGLPQNFAATRYHSLVVKRQTLPSDLIVTAETADGTIMGLAHKHHRVYGVQFHPESIASQHGHEMINNFLKLAGVK